MRYPERNRPAGRPGEITAYLNSFNRQAGRQGNYNRQPFQRKGRFRRDLLPNPADYYREHLPDLRPSGNGWANAKCPFHDDKSPSLSVHLGHGGYRCWSAACAAKGGDVLDFKAAARALGACEVRR